MLITLLGSLLGGLFRLAPEVLKWLSQKQDNAHELAMFDKQLEADRVKGAQAQQMAQTQADTSISVAELQAIVEATKAQSVQTGVKWVDAMSALMRPMITFWWVIVLYTSALVAQFVVMLDLGTSGMDAIVLLWGQDEKAIVASIIAFWFVDRSLRKK